MMPVSVTIRRGTARFATREVGIASRHSLSFGSSYDPARLRLGAMVCHDDHVLGAGRGFATHPHRDLEILSWVLEGGLDHRDAAGGGERVEPGSLALLRAGSGVAHSERAAPGGPCRFVQAWLVPDEPGGPASYVVTPVEPALLAGRLGLVAAGDGAQGAAQAPVHLAVAGASLHVARLPAGRTLRIEPAGAVRQVFLSVGALVRTGMPEPLAAGDSYEITDASHQPALEITAAVPTEVMMWTFGTSRGRDTPEPVDLLG